MSLNNSILPTKINRFGRRDSLIKQGKRIYLQFYKLISINFQFI